MTGPLTASLRQRLKRGGLDIVSMGGNLPKLEVVIVEVIGKPGTLSAREGRLVPLDTIVDIRVEVKISDSGGDRIVGPEVVGVGGRAYSGGSVMAEEASGHMRRQALVDRLAGEIVSRFFERD